MKYDFEVVQHMAARVHRDVKQRILPSLRAELDDARRTLVNGLPWRTESQCGLVERLSELSGSVEQLALLEAKVSDYTMHKGSRAMAKALRVAQDECSRLETEALSLLSAHGAAGTT
uniref:Uncharacterized protein n=1 Tax=Neobodo designis TaxID=312471 RepID=A0A7S1LE75_NEODS